jgi:dipeptidyl aminopeptidase/acylaminoacyl peptidase
MVETPYWTPERIIGYPGIADLDVSPDGREVLYAIGESLMTDDENRFVFHLYRVAVGQVPLRLTFGVAANTMPRWSPDGHTIAFLSDRAGAANIYLMQSAGGEAWPLTAMEKGVQSYAWSPDGSQIAFRAVPPDDEARQAAKKAKDDVIHWDGGLRVRATVDRAGRRGGQPRPEPRQLTREPRQVTARIGPGDPAGGGAGPVYTHAASPVDNDWATSRLALLPLAEGATPRDLGAAPTWGPPCLGRAGGWRWSTARTPTGWPTAA